MYLVHSDWTIFAKPTTNLHTHSSFYIFDEKLMHKTDDNYQECWMESLKFEICAITLKTTFFNIYVQSEWTKYYSSISHEWKSTNDLFKNSWLEHVTANKFWTCFHSSVSFWIFVATHFIIISSEDRRFSNIRSDRVSQVQFLNYW